MSKKSIVVFATVAIIALTNFVVIVGWQSRFPNFPIMSHSVKEVQNIKTIVPIDKPIPSTTDSPAVLLASQLIAALTIPSGWVSSPTDKAVLGSPLDSYCPNTNPIQPVITNSISLNRESGGFSGGGFAEVSIYSAGLGAMAMDAINKQISHCGSMVWLTQNKHLGIQSISINDTSSKMNSGPGGRTIWVRQGDIVGLISIRGNNLYSTDSIMSNWITSWNDILTSDICPNLDSIPSDATRSPLSNNYKGYTQTQKVVLTPEELTAADAKGAQLVSNAASSMNSTDSTIPDRAIDLTSVVPLLNYPASLTIVLPANKPSITIPTPKFPSTPVGETITGLNSDLIGPGCGWALTGLLPPTFDNKTSSNNLNQLLITAHNQLSSSWSQWWLAKWQYKQTTQQYLTQVDAWNTWAIQANQTIARALWANYDSQVTAYQQAQSDYLRAHQLWVDSCSVTPSPSPSPTSSNTPIPEISPTTTPSSCGNEPIAPLPPTEPTIPKP